MRAVMHVLDRKVVSSHGRFNVVWAGLNLAVCVTLSTGSHDEHNGIPVDEVRACHNRASWNSWKHLVLK
jgi:hypothetical protein